MKKIETLIQPQLWSEARAVFQTLGVHATLREVQTFGGTPPRREVYRGSAFVAELSAELELTTVVEDERAEGVVQALQSIARDSEILITTVEGVVRARPATGMVRAAEPVGDASVSRPPARPAAAHAWSARAF